MRLHISCAVHAHNWWLGAQHASGGTPSAAPLQGGGLAQPYNENTDMTEIWIFMCTTLTLVYKDVGHFFYFLIIWGICFIFVIKWGIFYFPIN